MKRETPTSARTASGPERALLVAVELTGPKRPAAAVDAGESLNELAALAGSAGAEVLEKILQSRPSYDPATLVGRGKLDELKGLVRGLEVDLVLFDQELGGAQQRNLEKALDCKVVDRTQLILDIFARRARTREGQLQVELAQLNYLLPRLTGRGIMMSRLGGGIGTRGPGETKLETDRRRIHQKIKKIERDLEAVRGSRNVQRRLRQAVPLATVALVGYTNAGKSTLFNRLTGASVLADAKMFATLDPTVRQATLPSKRRVLLSDTVGFIRQLPTTLVEAFRATLEEVVEASLLLHVVDATSPAASEHCAHVRAVLAEIGAGKTDHVLVMNKCDALEMPPGEREALARRLSGEESGAPVVEISAVTGEGIAGLLATVDRVLGDDPVHAVKLRFPLSDLSALHWVHEYGQVERIEYGPEECDVEARVPESVRRRLRGFEVD